MFYPKQSGQKILELSDGSILVDTDRLIPPPTKAQTFG
jgi:hypothetical protein